MKLLRTTVFLLMLAPVSTLCAETWVDLTPTAGPAPSPRRNVASVYDPVGHRLVLFGGRITGSTEVNDTWAFDLATNSWTELTPATGPSPGARFTANGVYDPVQHAMIIWAGQGPLGFLNDVWAFDLTSETWSQYQPPAPQPEIRYGTASVFDPLNRKLISFAGFTDSGRFDDTWSFDVDGVQWADVSPGAGPMQRCLHDASYDILGQRMIVYAGNTDGGFLDDIWAYDIATGTWREMTPAVRPQPTFFTAFTYDSTRHRNLIFGGLGVPNNTWSFDLESETFTQLFPGGATAPTSRYGAAGHYIVAEDRMIVFGGQAGSLYKNEVWSLELTPLGEIRLPWEILADGDSFRWPIPANVEWVRGPLDELDVYQTDTSLSAVHATSFSDSDDPVAGQGFWYLVKFQGSRGSWQSVAGGEVGRDTLIP